MSEWIRVADRIPDPHVDVLVTDGIKLCIRHIDWFGREYYWEDYDEPDWPLHKATHWMPLPDLPNN